MFALTIFLSAFLLFSLEPLIAKRILPWFGGSAAVWSTCLVFYQTALLAGYLYASQLRKIRSAQLQAGLHIGVLLVSIAFLPVGPGLHWRNANSSDPGWLILGMLTASIGVPFVALSATSPLLQHWLSLSGYGMPYRLFAISNLASFAALVSYPFLIEPMMDMGAQRTVWSAGYALFVIACGTVAWVSRRGGLSEQAGAETGREENQKPRSVQRLIWFLLAACGSMLLLALTNHLTENVAPVPLLWVLPLAVYLLTFVIAFGRSKVYNRSLWLRFLAVALGVLGYSLYTTNALFPIQVSVPISLLGLFVCCMFCHGELNRIRPDPHYLTDFYLMIAAGGACGAIFVGVISPQIFSGIFELPVALLVTAMLVFVVTWPGSNWAVRLLWACISVAMVLILQMNVSNYHRNALSVRRSFYGSLRVVQSPLAGERQTRTLYHGTIEHGAQFLLPPMRFRPTTYYGPGSGIGIVLRECFPSPKHVGMVGLGTATLAAYGQAGDTFRFYEINQQVEDISKSLFFYLRESKAQVSIMTGDARLSIEHDTSPLFDVLALDAFSGDAIPVHLITREAVDLYLRHLKPDGVLAFHVSNHYLDLASVVKQLADGVGYQSVMVRDHEDDDELVLPADWVLVTKNTGVLENDSVKVHQIPITVRAGLRPWTDDYNNLLQILKTPTVK